METISPSTAATVAQVYSVVLLVVALEASRLRYRRALTTPRKFGVISGAILRTVAVVGTALSIGAAMWSVINDKPLSLPWTWIVVVFGAFIGAAALLIMIESLWSDVRRRFADAAKTAAKEAAEAELLAAAKAPAPVKKPPRARPPAVKSKTSS